MVVIRTTNISKIYKIYQNPTDRLKEIIHPFKKQYSKKFYALNNVSFSVKKGEIVGIIGRNGVGKSTLLKLLAGVIQPSSGDINVKGKISSILELGVGFNTELTGLENIFFFGALNGYSTKQMKTSLDSILKFAEIGEYINQPLKSYSSGMYARLAFSVAISIQPEILIVDEILSVGDIFFQAKCMAKMKELMRQNVTIIFVSHDIEMIKGFCKRVIWLEKGKVVSEGNASKVVTQYTKSLVENINILNASDPSRKKDAFLKETAKFQDQEFFKKNEGFRTGTGDSLFKRVEILDQHGNRLKNELQYNQQIVIKAYIEIIHDCKNIAIVYHVLNRQRQYIIGDDTFLSETGIYDIEWKQGDRFIVSFNASLPLLFGEYSISMMISHFSDTKSFSNPLFFDWIENVFVFKMNKRLPYQIFDYVYIENNDVSYKCLPPS